MTPTHQEELLKAREELAALLRKKEEIEITIARQKRKVAAWSELCDESEIGDGATEALESLGLDLGGLSDACRTAMRASRKEWMTITEIQETLKELGFPLDKYKAPTASITTTVNRLADAKEVVVEKRPGGASEYRWVGPAISANANIFRVGTSPFYADKLPDGARNITHPVDRIKRRRTLGDIMKDRANIDTATTALKKRNEKDEK